jgi:membrane-associated phospholipid phosphatase
MDRSELAHSTADTALPAGQRLRFAAILAACFGVWLAAYEIVGTLASRLPSHDLSTTLDRALPLVPSAVFVYVLCYALPFLPVLVVPGRRAMLAAALAALLVNVAAFCTYVLFPVSFPRPQVGDSWPERLLAFIYSFEFTPSANNMPSLHVAMSWLVWLVCRPHLSAPARRALLALVLAVFVSTLLVKQHIVIDVITGLLYAQLALAAAQRILGAGATKHEGRLPEAAA